LSRIDRHIVDMVRDRTDIAAIIGRHVRLERRGNSLVGLCPFHNEKSPSFNVIPQKGMYYCFGCQAGGDVFRFLMLVEGLSFVEAVKELAGPAGVEVPERELTADERASLRARATQYDILEAGAGFYEGVLWTRPEGQAGRDYLLKRALSNETAHKGRVGFAPPGWTSLVDWLHRKGYPAELAVEVGLAKKAEGGRIYDAFRDRIMFPIRDEKSRVIGFGGRILEGDGPKYINTPETRLYQKSHVLYGLEMARNAIQQRDRALVVEGYFDVLMLHQAGFAEAIATCGTALTAEHLERIRRMTSNVVILLDADEAGSRAAEKVVPMFLNAGLNPWRLQIPGAKDPDELIREEGPAAMEAALQKKQPLVEWFIDRKLEKRGSSAAGWQQTLTELMPLLVHLPDGTLSRVAARLGQRDEVLREQVRKQKPVAGAPAPPAEPLPEPGAPPAWKPSRDLVHLLWLAVHRYDQVADVLQRMDPSLVDAPVREAIARLVTGEPVVAVIPELGDPEVRRTLQAVVARTELYEADHAAVGACEIIERLAAPRRDHRLHELTRSIEDALRDGDGAAHRAAAAERAQLIKEKNSARTLLHKKDVKGYLALVAARNA
jgi:DNA primase